MGLPNSGSTLSLNYLWTTGISGIGVCRDRHNSNLCQLDNHACMHAGLGPLTLRNRAYTDLWDWNVSISAPTPEFQYYQYILLSGKSVFDWSLEDPCRFKSQLNLFLSFPLTLATLLFLPHVQCSWCNLSPTWQDVELPTARLSEDYQYCQTC